MPKFYCIVAVESDFRSLLSSGLYWSVYNFTFQTQKGSDKENFSITDKSDIRLVQEKHGNENNVCDSNEEECTVENPEMEKELGREKHGIAGRANWTRACTEEWRDWSLQLTGRGSLIITGKADKWIFGNLLFTFINFLYLYMRQLNAFTSFSFLFWTSWSALYSSPNRFVFLFNPSHLSSPYRFVCLFCVSRRLRWSSG